MQVEPDKGFVSASHWTPLGGSPGGGVRQSSVPFHSSTLWGEGCFGRPQPRTKERRVTWGATLTPWPRPGTGLGHLGRTGVGVKPQPLFIPLSFQRLNMQRFFWVPPPPRWYLQVLAWSCTGHGGAWPQRGLCRPGVRHPNPIQSGLPWGADDPSGSRTHRSGDTGQQ